MITHADLYRKLKGLLITVILKSGYTCVGTWQGHDGEVITIINETTGIKHYIYEKEIAAVSVKATDVKTAIVEQDKVVIVKEIVVKP